MMKIETTGALPATVGHVGTVEDVIAGRLPKELACRRFKADDFSVGFELATTKNIQSMGEALLVNGYCYATSTDQASPDYNQPISDKTFISGGMFLHPKDAKATHRVQIDENKEILEFYNDLYKQVKRPLSFAGLVHFSSFHGVAIGKPPINGLNIFENEKEYYPNPDVHAKDVYGFVVGAMSDFVGNESLNEQLKAALYKNPLDKSSALVHHAHVLLLKRKVNSWKEVVPEVVDQVLHLYVDGTSLVSADLEVYAIGKAEDYMKFGEVIR